MKRKCRTKSKKIIAFALSIIASFGCIGVFGCGSSEKVDTSKTQLKIGVYNGGGGTAWIETIADIFEERYANVSFEEGKTGVQIWVQPGKDQFTDETLLNNMPSGEYDMYFTQNISYTKAVSKNAFMDITDILNEKYDVIDFGDGEKTYSIKDKMTEEAVDYFGLEQNGQTKYYALGFMSYLSGIIYDVDLFCEKGFYFDENGNLGASLDNKADVLSKGPDGKVGTVDDGLPSTWEEMKELMSYMLDNDVVPFTWSGQYTYQRDRLFNTIWMSYEGADDFLLNFSMNGTTVINGVEKQITPETGYELALQEGKLAALTAIRDIVSNSKNYSNQAFLSSQSHTGAQREYILSSFQNEPIAMLIESSYWENEATAYFAEMENTYGKEWGQYQRRFGFLPIPRFAGTDGVPDQTSTETVFNGQEYSLAFINAYTRHELAAKELFKFIYSNEMISLSKGMTGISRSVRYKMVQSDYDKMSYFQKQIYELESNNRVVNHNLPKNKDFAYGAKECMQYWDRTIKYNGTVYKDLFKDFADSFKSGTPLNPIALFNSYAQNANADNWSL